MKDEKLSEYELARLENIKKNEEFLKSLGLYRDPADLAAQNTLPAAKKSSVKRKRKERKDDSADPDYVEEESASVPVRRSARNSGASVQHQSLDGDEPALSQTKEKRRYNPMEDAEKFFQRMEESGDESIEEDEDRKRVVLKPNDIREYVDSISPEHSSLISDKAIQLCAYRCGYMSIAALKNRIKAISRGASKKSYEKLLVVSYTMRAMGLHRLAETSAALLKARTGLVLSWCPTGSTTTLAMSTTGDADEADAEEVENILSTANIGNNNNKESKIKVEVKTEAQEQQQEHVSAASPVHINSSAGTPGTTGTAGAAVSRKKVVIKQEKIDIGANECKSDDPVADGVVEVPVEGDGEGYWTTSDAVKNSFSPSPIPRRSSRRGKSAE